MLIHVKQYTIFGAIYVTFTDLSEALDFIRICIRNGVPVDVTYLR